ncbi:hypothetical protein BB048_10205 [Vibrio parahaemolyticus]|uniref:hypothetical protein n=1 Tax=Vibrio parahaemolyticus TaxID=670 RepID=UPI0008D9D1D6|nr:hypothetical protein [Vibrio parahaemolyticus]OHX38908.1 hypothetical protein BB048_10205 [Vibrio parahaemolyticus]
MKNKQAKQMICDIELLKRNGITPNKTQFHFRQGVFGYTFLMRTGWFFRGIYYGTVRIDCKGNNIDELES